MDQPELAVFTRDRANDDTRVRQGSLRSHPVTFAHRELRQHHMGLVLVHAILHLSRELQLRHREPPGLCHVAGGEENIREELAGGHHAQRVPRLLRDRGRLVEVVRRGGVVTHDHADRA